MGVKMRKTNFLILLFGLLFIIGCTQQGAQTKPSDQNAPSTTGETTQASQGELKEFTMTAKQFEFNPSVITVNKGDRVKVTITSADVTHGFVLPDFGINEKLEPNKPITIEFTADKTGTFPFRCNVPCGSGHTGMKGTIVVE